MTVKAKKETLGFEAEVNQLLHLMVNALYSNKEIFLRELVSNASDAIDKLRFEGLSDPALLEDDSELNIHIDFDAKKRTVSIVDNGIGMSREEVIENLGTIAKSGTKEFLAALSGEQTRDAHLIGQFGVGFYASFIVADKVTVISRRAGLTAEHGVRWESDGHGQYTIENIEKAARGTEIILHLKKDETEFLDAMRLRTIITKYSDHITVPILMAKIQDEQDKKDKKPVEWETVNRAKALWTLPKNKIQDEEYEELYKHIAHDFEAPLCWSHNKVEGKLDYISLLYIPSRAPFDLWNREQRHGLKLYVKRVFIMDDAEQFLPMYLRFVRGVVDSSDLPLNISREILQENLTTQKMRSALTKRVLDMLEKMSKNDPEQYRTFWSQFGNVLKEGTAEDFSNKETIGKLLRFASTHADTPEQVVTLEDYIGRMKDKQESIYYITAESFQAAKNSPHLEIFRKKGIEVLLLSDRIDEWLVTHLTEFGGKSLQSVAKGSLDVEKLEDKPNKKAKETREKTAEDFSSTITHVKDVLGEKVKEVRLTYRLTSSPACVVADDYDMNRNMQRIMTAMGQAMPASKPIFELNPEHAMVKRLKDEQDDARFAEWVDILFDQSILAEGGQLDDPASFVGKLNKLLLELAE